MSITVTLDRPIFAPGEAVTGTVEVCTGARLKLNGVHVKLQADRVLHRHGRTSRRRLLELRETCFGMRETKSYLEAGTYRYPLCLQLPADAPPSSYHVSHHPTCRGNFLAIGYKLTAVLDIPLRRDDKCRVPFLVVARQPADTAAGTADSLKLWHTQVVKGGFLGLFGAKRRGEYIATTVWVANATIALPGVRRAEHQLFAAAGLGRRHQQVYGCAFRGLFRHAEAGWAAMRRLPPLTAPAPGDDPPQLRLRVAVDNSSRKKTLRCLRVQLHNVVAIGRRTGAALVLQEDMQLTGVPQVNELGSNNNNNNIGGLARGVPPRSFAVFDLTLPAPPAVMLYRPGSCFGFGAKADAKRPCNAYGTAASGAPLHYPTLVRDSEDVKSRYRLRLSYGLKGLEDYETDTAIAFVPGWPSAAAIGDGDAFGLRNFSSRAAAAAATKKDCAYGVPIYDNEPVGDDVDPAVAAREDSGSFHNNVRRNNNTNNNANYY